MMNNKANNFFVLLIFAAALISCGQEGLKPDALVVSEGFENPLGFYDSRPSFSWKLPVAEGVSAQSAYRIVAASDPSLLPEQADLWDSGEVKSDQSAWVKYEGKPLVSRQKAYWQVKYWDQSAAASAWSEIAHFELGLLNNEDWEAKWISLPREEQMDTTEEGYHLYRPQYLIRDFKLLGELKQARLYITAKGVFEAQLNGEKVGEDVMTPGWTPYKERIETLTYDVKDYLKEGDNVIGLILGEGWYSGRIGFNRRSWGQKPLPEVICQLEILYQDGKKETILSDANWKGSRNGPIRFSGIYDGEIYDAKLEMPGWSNPGFDSENWMAVEESDLDADVRLLPKRHAAVANKIELPTLEVTEPEPGKFVFDLGQNMVGVPRLEVPVKKDQTLTIRFAELLQQDGTLYTDNYRSAKSTDYYKPKADGTISWTPKFTFHGFRYVELSGFDESARPVKDWVVGLVQYSDFEKTGFFRSSHDKLNQLQSNIEWGLRGNFFDIPTDCPQRDERLGWTGDAQVFAPTSIFNGDVHAFWASWLQSLREEQFENGGIPWVVPNILGNGVSSGWADAATVIPWEIYFRTGDIEVLEENYEMMKGLVRFYQFQAENYIADVTSFRDWLQPYQDEDKGRRGDTPQDLIGTAYFARTIDLTINAAKTLGKDKEAEELQKLRNAVKDAFIQKFLDSEGKLIAPKETQTAYLMALGFNLTSEQMAKKVLSHLIRQIKEADNHLRTGFLGTPLLAPVLDAYGRPDLMYAILFKETYPSWFFSIDQGATTMWERWNSYSHEDGFGDAGMNSFNHYAYGAVGQWMYERIAGLSPLEPGYKKILIAPLPGGPLEHAEAKYNSIYGEISSAWRKVDTGLELDATIPPNTTARIVIPIEAGKGVLANGEAVAGRSDVQVVEENGNQIVLEVIPGSYHFKTM